MKLKVVTKSMTNMASLDPFDVLTFYLKQNVRNNILICKDDIQGKN